MGASMLADFADQIQTFWADLFVPEWLPRTVLPSVVSTDYEGEIRVQGDTVKVSAIRTPEGSIKTIGVPGYENYSPEKLETAQIQIKADTIIEASVKIDNLAMLQSQIAAQESNIRSALMNSMTQNMNKFLYGKLLAAATDQTSVTDFNHARLLVARKFAADNSWPDNEGFLLLDSSYMNDLLATGVLTSSDYVSDMPIMQGRQVYRRHGLSIVEDNTPAMSLLSPTEAAADLGLLIHPSALYLVMQMQPTFKLSDLHASEKRGFLLTAELVCGADKGIDPLTKHQKFYNN